MAGRRPIEVTSPSRSTRAPSIVGFSSESATRSPTATRIAADSARLRNSWSTRPRRIAWNRLPAMATANTTDSEAAWNAAKPVRDARRMSLAVHHETDTANGRDRPVETGRGELAAQLTHEHVNDIGVDVEVVTPDELEQLEA